MKRKIIKIDEKLCVGCGLCVKACHESAIQLVNGKAKLMRDDYCDGLGNCLPSCPTKAITFEEREAPAYDATAVAEHKKNIDGSQNSEKKLPCGCPSSNMKVFDRSHNAHSPCSSESAPMQANHSSLSAELIPSELRQFPIQIQLVPQNAPYFQNADVLIAADCTAFAYGNFHHDFMKDKITLVGCPKLDTVDYSNKLTEILQANDIKSITIARMEVPCCAGIVEAVKTALKNSEKVIPWSIVTITRDGKILK
ncbi:MAG: ATP-binding protein [Treponemataceae bacterium]